MPGLSLPLASAPRGADTEPPMANPKSKPKIKIGNRECETSPERAWRLPKFRYCTPYDEHLPSAGETGVRWRRSAPFGTGTPTHPRAAELCAEVAREMSPADIRRAEAMAIEFLERLSARS
jgi:hypothetical protein